ncbi:Hypothetical protein I595_2410 [Croceitalea dokdonensis DOKDO 023]|uniref:DUF3291 domain-containing protein n=1 Tax=Croceitalea dokdonensis DOKDO 023 TaxID=1300341 RepID=A0A0P7AGQ1_9FLAO|nr:DUF3291 domain-containing protein [Croceitalea dokdonensis]KPM31146.1 Hypothetical protein I595_2410 [Croceitalea dokdonensis DOKDO 023]
MTHNLAQANIARFKTSLDRPEMKEFIDFLAPVNKFAEESDGFIWRLTDEQGRSASYIESPFNDEMMAVNISLWRDMDSFKNFVYGSVHAYFLQNKRKWFDVKGHSQFVMWWLPATELPSIGMAKEKLEHQQKYGDSQIAFSMRNLYDASGAKLVV